ncbi:MAG: phosphatase domain-containing protein [Bacteroidales bacterium]
MEKEIVSYSGFGNDEKIHVAGHAFKSYSLGNVKKSQRRLRNFLQMIRRYRLVPLKNHDIEVHINGTVQTLTTNSKGFFSGLFKHQYKKQGWQNYTLKFPDGTKTFDGKYLLVKHDDVGVISDIDDTVIVSHATHFWKKVALMLLKNAYSRKTIPNIKEFYRKIKELNEEKLPDEFFYVSNSEWNLFDMLRVIFSIHQLPDGIFMLNDLKIGLWELLKSGGTHSDHKINSIRFLLNFYPHKKFILIGDNGQKDMTIYTEICQRFPDRVQGVIIRIIKRKGMEEYQKFQKRIEGLQIPVGYLGE